MISRGGQGSVFAAEVAGRNLTTWKPRRKSGFALKQLTDQSGATYWILKNLRDNTYVRLSEEQVFVWNELDGDATVQDIAVAYMIAYGKLAINSLILLLDQLQQKGFIEDPLLDVYGAVDVSMARRKANVWWRRALGAFLNKEFAIQGIDGLITTSYRRFGRVLFTRPVQALLLIVALAGGVAFVAATRAGAYSVFTGAGGLLIVGVVTLYVLQFLTLLIHEWSHAVTTKHYRREVRKGGFLLYMGLPAAFVDTTDIWLSPRRERILVSWAGPYSGFILGGLAALGILAVPGTFAAGVLFQFAFLTYVTSFLNLNPAAQAGRLLHPDGLAGDPAPAGEKPGLRDPDAGRQAAPPRAVPPRRAHLRRVRSAGRSVDPPGAGPGPPTLGRRDPGLRAGVFWRIKQKQWGRMTG